MKTVEERRIEICKDALAQLHAKMYVATNNVYVRLGADLEKLKEESPDLDGKICLLEAKEPCKVCAKGALFLSLVRKENNVKLFELLQYRELDNITESLFEKDNLSLIEACFERWTIEDEGDFSEFEDYEYSDENDCYGYRKDIADFCDKYFLPEERLEAILLNMLANNGTFVLNSNI